MAKPVSKILSDIASSISGYKNFKKANKLSKLSDRLDIKVDKLNKIKNNKLEDFNIDQIFLKRNHVNALDRRKSRGLLNDSNQAKDNYSKILKRKNKVDNKIDKERFIGGAKALGSTYVVTKMMSNEDDNSK